MIKQVILIRADLNMRKGKMVAQGAHASLMVFMSVDVFGIYHHPISDYGTTEDWIRSGGTKICLKADNEEHLLSLFAAAKKANLPCSLVIDEGRTEFKGVPTPTAVAIGPADSEEIDKITGGLELL